MNVREALEKFVVVGGPVVGMLNANDLAPIIERALRAAYDCGFRDRCVSDPCDNHNGVTAGVAAMMEKS